MPVEAVNGIMRQRKSLTQLTSTGVQARATALRDMKVATPGKCSGQAYFVDASTATLRADGVPLYGLDKELAEKAAAKYDHAAEARCRQWIEALTGAPLGDGPLSSELKSGVRLCELVNAIKPGCCRKPSASGLAFKQMENIGFYLDAAIAIGVPTISSFACNSLYEAKDMGAVLVSLLALGLAAQRLDSFNGPMLGEASGK